MQVKPKVQTFEEPFLPECEPLEKPESKMEETTQDLGWALITKQKTYEFDADTDSFQPTTELPRILVRLRLDHTVIFEVPYVAHLNLDQVADSLAHCDERMVWYRNWKKELEEQLEEITRGADKVCGEEWIAYKSNTVKTGFRRRNHQDEAPGMRVQK